MNATPPDLQSAPSTATSVLLVDDHEVVLLGLRAVLGNSPSIRIVGEASTAALAVSETLRLHPDVVLMDVRLPDRSGIEACREILSERSETRVLFLTSFADDDSLLAAVLAGARGYILKEIDAASLVEAIQTVASGKSILDPTVTERALSWVRTQSDGKGDPKKRALSPSEERVLALVAEGKTNKEIAHALSLSERNVKTNLANLFEKLQVTRRSQAVAFYLKR